MELSSFDYEVPAELIAAEALQARSNARLLVFDRKTHQTKHAHFFDLPEFLREGDVLIVNNTKVIPARFLGEKISGGAIEGLFLEQTASGVRVWLKGRLSAGDQILIHGFGKVKIKSREGVRAELVCDPENFQKFLFEKGLTPLPPYILKERASNQVQESDAELYQSIFSKSGDRNSVAAPTASLHFDCELLEALRVKGIQIEEVSLHVGEGTFEPIRSEELDAHKMHCEWAGVSMKTWENLTKAKAEKRRLVSVGSTVTRTLESAWLRMRANLPIEQFETDLFIRPGFSFNMVDCLITNFHWPKSSLLVLVAAFLDSGKQQNEWRAIYENAIKERYRLFSFGDGMLIL